MQAIQLELGWASSASISTNDQTTKQILALMNASGDELSRRHQWTWLNRTASITTVAAQTLYDLPTGYQRQVSDTSFNQTQKWPMRGPLSSPEWSWLQAGYGATPPYYRYRLTAGQLEIYPAPTDSLTTLAFEYVSNFWVLGYTGAVNSVDKLKITADTDIGVFDNRLFIASTKLKFFETKGFENTKLKRDFDEMLELAKANDRGARTYDLLNQATSPLAGPWNIPESGWT